MTHLFQFKNRASLRGKKLGFAHSSLTSAGENSERAQTVKLGDAADDPVPNLFFCMKVSEHGTHEWNQSLFALLRCRLHLFG